MKRFIVALGIALLTVVFVPFAKAEEGWVITDFHSNIALQSDGRVQVEETIAVDFNNLEKHGIFRDIPYVYESHDSGKTYTEIDIVNVSRAGQPEPYETSKNSANVRIKIGDANKTISGQQTYKITYSAVGILHSFEALDELYWNVTGNDWLVPIEKTSTQVVLPSESIIQVNCFIGIYGSTTPCGSKEMLESEASFHAGRQLSVGEGLSIAVGYAKGLVPIVSVAPPPTIKDILFTPTTIISYILIALIGIVILLRLWWAKGRDLWIPFTKRSDPTAKASPIPLGFKDTIAPEFSPPENLRPAEIGVLVDEKADTLDVSASIVDLAVRGYLTITEEPKKWLFGSTDYTFNRTDKSDTDLLAYEKKLLGHLFDEGGLVKLSDLKNSFYHKLAEVKDELYLNVVSKNFFSGNPSSIRTKYACGGVVIIIVGGILGFLGVIGQVDVLTGTGFGLGLIGVVSIIMSFAMPRRTALGRELYRRAKGYELFLNTAEKYRQQFFEKENLLMEVLPYAIVFGVTGKLAKAFEQMGMQRPQPTWYIGTHPFNAVALSESMNSFSSTLSSAMASTPGGSGSGGGGFSGGGFGGGGGGSW